MTTVFIAGSISINRLHEKVRSRIAKIVASSFEIVVGDADGADTSIQECLRDLGANNVTVFCTGEHPRNNVNQWPVRHVVSKAKAGSRAFFTAKDVEMARTSDYGLMIWDSKSTGTLSNVLELLGNGKKSVIFVNKATDFVTVVDAADLDHLLSFMSATARAKADQKIDLTFKLAKLSSQIREFDLTGPADAVAPVPLRAPEARGPTPATERASLRFRSALLAQVRERLLQNGLARKEVAERSGVSQSTLADLMEERGVPIKTDALIDIAEALGVRVGFNPSLTGELSATRFHRH